MGAFIRAAVVEQPTFFNSVLCFGVRLKDETFDYAAKIFNRDYTRFHSQIGPEEDNIRHCRGCGGITQIVKALLHFTNSHVRFLL